VLERPQCLCRTYSKSYLFSNFAGFLSRVSILTRDIDIANLSVRPSVTFRYHNENGLTYRHSFFSPYGSPIILFYQHQTSSRNSDGVTPCGGSKYKWGMKISRFSTNKSLYLANDARYRHSYYGKLIGNRIKAFEWHQFHWPRVTSNPDFKVTILFKTSNNSKMVQDSVILTMADE